jgi:hypothetical protein
MRRQQGELPFLNEVANSSRAGKLAAMTMPVRPVRVRAGIVEAISF